MQESNTEMVRTRKEAITRLSRKRDSGDGTTLEKKKRKTEAEMDGLCQPRHESHDRILVGGELCLPQRSHNKVRAFKRIRHVA